MQAKKGREGNGREGNGREGNGREWKGREGKGKKGKGREGRKEGREAGVMVCRYTVGNKLHAHPTLLS